MDGGPHRPLDRSARLAQRAEAVGFDSLWVYDHFLYEFGEPPQPPHGIWECWSLLAALAATTACVEVGTYVIGTGFRNPALLAKMSDTVDEISGGRLILGVGAGNHEYECRVFGYPTDHKVSRFEVAIQIIHGLLRKEPSTSTGLSLRFNPQARLVGRARAGRFRYGTLSP